MEIHVLLGLLIPVAFLGFTGMVKSIVRNCWTWANFYLGIDIALAAFANGLVNIVDLAHGWEHHNPDVTFGQMTYTGVSIVISFASLLIAMGLHQRFEVLKEGANGNQRRLRGILLGIVANVTAGVALGLFIYWKLRRLV